MTGACKVSYAAVKTDRRGCMLCDMVIPIPTDSSFTFEIICCVNFLFVNLVEESLSLELGASMAERNSDSRHWGPIGWQNVPAVDEVAFN